MSPAACQVVPEVSRSRSSRTTSRHPKRPRWYATEVPITPPPITTAGGWLGRLTGMALTALTPLLQRPRAPAARPRAAPATSLGPDPALAEAIAQAHAEDTRL